MRPAYQTRPGPSPCASVWSHHALRSAANCLNLAASNQILARVPRASMDLVAGPPTSPCRQRTSMTDDTTKNDSRGTPNPVVAEQPASPPAPRPREIGGPRGPEPTRYGDWERKGRCVDF
ncbi:MAG: succinate dehydrogenase assembly factor 4 [Gammaproteobacteria bacterium]